MKSAIGMTNNTWSMYEGSLTPDRKGNLVGFQCKGMPRTNVPGYEIFDCLYKECVSGKSADVKFVPLKFFLRAFWCVEEGISTDGVVDGYHGFPGE